VLVSGTNGFVINAAATDKVILRGLDFEGLGTGLDGVKILQAGNVRIENSTIDNFTQSGVEAAPSTASQVMKVTLINDEIYNSQGNAFTADPTNGSKVKATLINDQIENDDCGAVAAVYGMASSTAASNCGANTGTGASANNVQITAFGTTVADNGLTPSSSGVGSSGFLAEGSGATIRIGQDNIFGNVNGVFTADGGVVTSFGNNQNIGNNNNGTPTAPGASTTSLRVRGTKHRATRHTKKHRASKR
jgi:hypothetical protein